MATQRLSNILSHVTPGKSPLEQMYASQTPLHNFPQIISITMMIKVHLGLITSTAPPRTPTTSSSHSPSELL
jgi:hypothetical protein